MIRATSLLLCMVFSLAGCSATPEYASDPFDAAPMDFGLDVTILTGEDARHHSEVHLRQSRYVLFSDGALHYGASNERGPDWMPDLARRLTRAQVAEIWSRARQLGFADAASGDDPTNFNLVVPQSGEVVYLIAFTGADDRWEFIRHRQVEGSSDAASTELIRLLAQMAWASDLQASEWKAPPSRYNLGPDPHARYRK